MGGLLQNRYISLRKKLDEMGYQDAFGIDSLPLVERIFMDLLKATENLQKYVEESTKYRKIARELEDGVEPFREENLKLIKENSHLRLALQRSEDKVDQAARDAKLKSRDLESENSELKLLITHFVDRVKKQEIESLEKTRKMAQLQERNLQANVTVKDGSKNKLVPFKTQEMVIQDFSPKLCPHCVRIRNFAEFGKGRDPATIDYMQVADSRIEALTLQNKLLKTSQQDLMELIKALKGNMERKTESSLDLRLSLGRIGRLDGDGDENLLFLERHPSNDLRVALKSAQLQIQVLHKRNQFLETKMQNNLLYDDFVTRRHHKTAAEREFHLSLMDLDKCNYHSTGNLAQEDKLKLLERQLSHCCEEKAKLKALLVEYDTKYLKRPPSAEEPDVTHDEDNDDRVPKNKEQLSANKKVALLGSSKSQTKTQLHAKNSVRPSLSKGKGKPEHRAPHKATTTTVPTKAQSQKSVISTTGAGGKSSTKVLPSVKTRTQSSRLTIAESRQKSDHKKKKGTSEPRIEAQFVRSPSGTASEDEEFNESSSPFEDEPGEEHTSDEDVEELPSNVQSEEFGSRAQQQPTSQNYAPVRDRSSPMRTKSSNKGLHQQPPPSEHGGGYPSRSRLDEGRASQIHGTTSSPERHLKYKGRGIKVQELEMLGKQQPPRKSKSQPTSQSSKDYGQFGCHEPESQDYGSHPFDENTSINPSSQQGSRHRMQPSESETQGRGTRSRPGVNQPERESSGALGPDRHKSRLQLQRGTQPSSTQQLQNGRQPSAQQFQQGTQPSTTQQFQQGTQPSTTQQFQQGTQPSTTQQFQQGTQPSTTHQFPQGTQPSTHQFPHGTQPSQPQLHQGTQPSNHQYPHGTQPSQQNLHQGTQPSTQQLPLGTQSSQQQLHHSTQSSKVKFQEGTQPSHQQLQQGTQPSEQQLLDRGKQPSTHPSKHGLQPTTSQTSLKIPENVGRQQLPARHPEEGRQSPGSRSQFGKQPSTQHPDDYRDNAEGSRQPSSYPPDYGTQPEAQYAGQPLSQPPSREFQRQPSNQSNGYGQNQGREPSPHPSDHAGRQSHSRPQDYQDGLPQQQQQQGLRYEGQPPSRPQRSHAPGQGSEPSSHAQDYDRQSSPIQGHGYGGQLPSQDQQYGRQQQPSQGQEYGGQQQPSQGQEYGRHQQPSQAEEYGRQPPQEGQDYGRQQSQPGQDYGRQPHSEPKGNSQSPSVDAFEPGRNMNSQGPNYGRQPAEKTHGIGGQQPANGKQQAPQPADGSRQPQHYGPQNPDDYYNRRGCDPQSGTEPDYTTGQPPYQESEPGRQQGYGSQPARDYYGNNATSQQPDDSRQRPPQQPDFNRQQPPPQSNEYGRKPQDSSTYRRPPPSYAPDFASDSSSQPMDYGRPQPPRQDFSRTDVRSDYSQPRYSQPPPRSESPDIYDGSAALPRKEYGRSPGGEYGEAVANLRSDNSRTPSAGPADMGYSPLNNPHKSRTWGGARDKNKSTSSLAKKPLGPGERKKESVSFPPDTNEFRPSEGRGGPPEDRRPNLASQQSTDLGRRATSNPNPSRYRDRDTRQQFAETGRADAVADEYDQAPGAHDDKDPYKRMMEASEGESAEQRRLGYPRYTSTRSRQDTTTRRPEPYNPYSTLPLTSDMKSDELLNRIRGMERIIDNLQIESNVAKSTKSDMEKEIQKLRRALAECQEHGKQLNGENQKIKIVLEQTQALLQDTQRKAAANYVPTQRENLELNQQVRQLVAREMVLEREVAALTSTVKALDRDKDEMRVELDSKDEKLARFHTENRQLTEQMGKLQLELKGTELKLAHTGESTRDQEREVLHLKRQIDTLKDDLERRIRERDNAQKELNRLNQSSSKQELEKRSMTVELEKRGRESDELRKHLQHYIDEVRRIEDLLLKKEEEMEMLMENYRILSQEKGLLETHRSILDSQQSFRAFEGSSEGPVAHSSRLLAVENTNERMAYEEEVAKVSALNASLESQLRSSQDREKLLQMEVNGARDMCLRLESELDSLRLTASNAESIKNQLQAKTSDLLSTVDLLESQLAAETESKRKLEDLLAKLREKEFQAKDMNANLSAERDALSVSVTSLQSRTDQLNAQIERYRLKSAELQMELEKVKRQYQNEKSEREAALTELKNLQAQLSNSSTSMLLNSTMATSRTPSPSPIQRQTTTLGATIPSDRSPVPRTSPDYREQ